MIPFVYRFLMVFVPLQAPDFTFAWRWPKYRTTIAKRLLLRLMLISWARPPCGSSESDVFPQPRSFYKGKHRINHDKSIDLGIPMDTPFSEPMFDQILSSSRSQFSLGAKLHFPQVIGLVMIQAQLLHRMFLWHTGSHFGPRNIGIIWNNRCLTI